ncbi:1327_t:CDS:1, partial [Rhizophagus irregularis]
MVYLSIEKRSRICALLEEGYPSRYVADKEKISQSTVIRIKKRKDATRTFKDKPKSGRPRLLTGQNERKVLRYITTGVCTNAVAIKKKLKIEEQIGVSESTVKRTLHRNGLGARVKRCHPRLPPVDKHIFLITTLFLVILL